MDSIKKKSKWIVIFGNSPSQDSYDNFGSECIVCKDRNFARVLAHLKKLECAYAYIFKAEKSS